MNYELDDSITHVVSKTITKYQIQQIMVHLFSGCTIAISLRDANDSVVENTYLEMNQSDYELWSNDDNYIIEWINAELRRKYQILPPPPITTTETNTVGITPEDVAAP
mgnify:CR=1 FL=1